MAARGLRGGAQIAEPRVALGIRRGELTKGRRRFRGERENSRPVVLLIGARVADGGRPLLENGVRVRSAKSEGADSGAARCCRLRPGPKARVDDKWSGGEID